MTVVIESERLLLRKLTVDDIDFVLAITHDPEWLTYIGDRGVANKAQAGKYIGASSDSFAAQGYGLWLVVAKHPSGDNRIGLCGFIRRPFLGCPDLGYAFLPSGRGQGYATEAVRLVLDWAATRMSGQVSAICRPDNQASLAVLQRSGFTRVGQIYQPDQPVHHFFLRTI